MTTRLFGIDPHVISSGDNVLVVAGTTCAVMGTNTGLSTGAITCSPDGVENWGQRALKVFLSPSRSNEVCPQFTGLITSISHISPSRLGQSPGSLTKQDAS